jgi:hypothetical protein
MGFRRLGAKPFTRETAAIRGMLPEVYHKVVKGRRTNTAINGWYARRAEEEPARLPASPG